MIDLFSGQYTLI